MADNQGNLEDMSSEAEDLLSGLETERHERSNTGQCEHINIEPLHHPFNGHEKLLGHDIYDHSKLEYIFYLIILGPVVLGWYRYWQERKASTQRWRDNIEENLKKIKEHS